jgi:hypothetical protein
MPLGELLTRWTVRYAVAFYVASLATRGFAPKSSRIAWTVGCLAYLLHVAAAFAYYHDWSHDQAYTFTAQQTNDVVGIDWGGGLYVNYWFTLVWIGDATWWWLNAESYRHRPRWLDASIHGFLGFIVFNATVVFATGFSRWFGIAACGLLIAVWYLEWKRVRPMR